MRLYLADTNSDGASFLRASEELADDVGQTIWFGPHPDITSALRNNSDEPRVDLEPAHSEVRWRLAVFEPDSSVSARPSATRLRYGEIHHTRTVDYDYVVSGRVVCRLDLDVVHLQRGDAIILPAARHAWENPTDSPASVLCLLLRPEADSTGSPRSAGGGAAAPDRSS